MVRAQEMSAASLSASEDAAAASAAEAAACRAELERVRHALSEAQSEVELGSQREAELGSQLAAVRAERHDGVAESEASGEGSSHELHSALEAQRSAEGERDQLLEEQRLLLREAERAAAALTAAEQDATELRQSLEYSRGGLFSPGGSLPGAVAVEDDDVLAKELADEIAALKVSHAKQVKQMQAELRKALSTAGNASSPGPDAAMQVMHAREVKSLQAEIRSLRTTLERVEAPPDSRPSQPSEPVDAWEVAVVGSLGELRHSLLATCRSLMDEVEAVCYAQEPKGKGLQLHMRSTHIGDSHLIDVGSRAALARLAATDTTDASDELRRLQQTAEALESIVERLVAAKHHGVQRPPRWLVLGWHYSHYVATSCIAVPAVWSGSARAEGPLGSVSFKRL